MRDASGIDDAGRSDTQARNTTRVEELERIAYEAKSFDPGSQLDEVLEHSAVRLTRELDVVFRALVADAMSNVGRMLVGGAIRDIPIHIFRRDRVRAQQRHVDRHTRLDIGYRERSGRECR